jgi:hypothetical protein
MPRKKKSIASRLKTLASNPRMKNAVRSLAVGAGRAMVRKAKALAFGPMDSGMMPSPYSVLSNLPTTASSPPMVANYHFSGCNYQGKHGLKVVGQMPFLYLWGNFGYSIDETALVDRAGAQLTAEYLDPTSANTLGNFLQLISSGFARYRFMRLILHYRPIAVAATSELSAVFGFSSDPDHPLLSISPTNAKILDAGGFRFVAWQPWDYECALEDTGIMKYGYGVTATVADKRQGSSGIVVCLNETSITATSNYGVLWATFEVELYEPAPLFSTINLERADGTVRTCGHELKTDVRRCAIPPGAVEELVKPGGIVDDYVVPLPVPRGGHGRSQSVSAFSRGSGG